MFNQALVMTSIGCTEVREGNFMPTFKISGNLYHRICSLLPSSEGSAKFLQIYFVGDSDKEATYYWCCYGNITQYLELMKELQGMLYENNRTPQNQNNLNEHEQILVIPNVFSTLDSNLYSKIIDLLTKYTLSLRS